MHSFAASEALPPYRLGMISEPVLKGGLAMVGSILLAVAGWPVDPAPQSSPEATTRVAAQAVAPVAASAPTALDSLEAEAQLDAVSVRRPLERYLGRFSADGVLVHRIARAIVRESRRQKVAPSLIAAVLVTENTTLTLAAESSVGAQGLMQVMPMHAGQLGCDSDDLTDVDSNICHGTRILARNLRATRSPAAALLRYNGCVKGTNTPDCWRYPARVLVRAGRMRREILSASHVVPGARSLANLAGAMQLAER